MNKVTTIHLGGIAYQLEESAYDTLRAYLDDASAKLVNDPDREEIIKDLEQAIGFKLNAHLNANKNVITQSEVEEVIKEMGPVNSGGTAHEQTEGDASAKTSGWPHKKLYRISEGRILAGVCTGLAAYFNVDVTLVRILFILLTIFSHGLGGVIYIVLMLVVPVARTAKDFEYAAGATPITAQELIDRAKKSIDDFKNSDEWKDWQGNWKHQRRAWKMQHKAWKAEQKRARYQYRGEYRHEHHSVVSEIFGVACATLAVSFVLWFLYGHVALVHDFFNALHNVYLSFIDSLAGVLYHGQ